MAKKKHAARRKPGAAKAASPAPGPSGRSATGSPAVRPKSAGRSKRGTLLAGMALAAAAGAAIFFLTRPKPIPVVRDPRMNVVLVTLDTTRADRLGCYGYAPAQTPNLDSLAARGVRFANAYSEVPLTLPSHTSIMTGLNPYAHGVHNNGTYSLDAKTPTLAQVLKGKGYKTAAFVASFSVDSRFGLDRGFDVYDDNIQPDTPFKSANAERKAEEVFQVFEPWFDKNAAGGEPFFVWIHFFDPHLPYNPPSPLREEFAGRLYDGEVAYMDFIFGLVMRKLVAGHLLGRTLVVAAGDHGESFGEKGESGHGVFLYEPAVHVPLIMMAQGHLPDGAVVAPRVRLIDILPTVLDLLETAPPARIQGESLLPYVRKKKTDDLDNYLETFYPKENFGWAALTGLLSQHWKYIHAPKEELYDLSSDPGEDRNIAGAGAEAGKLKARLDGLIRSAAGAPSAGRTLTAEEKNRLRSLGYVDYTDPAAKGGAADPKDKVGELKMIQDAEKAEYEGDFAAAAALHARMLELRPGAASSYINLALAQARLKKFDEAVATLKKGLARIPDSELLMTRLGFTYLATGKPDLALASMQDVLKMSPKSMDGLTASAMILDSLGRKEEARGAFEKALTVEPENKFVRVSYASNLMSSGKTAEALPVYAALVRDFPRDPGLYRSLGIAYGTAGDADKAIVNFQKFLELAPSPDAYYNLALAYMQKGETAEAVRSFEKYLSDPKNEPEPKVRRARQELARLKARRP